MITQFRITVNLIASVIDLFHGSVIHIGGQNIISICSTIFPDLSVLVPQYVSSEHFSALQFYVLPPGELEFIPTRVEAELMSELELPLAVYATFSKY